jgi:hypothetical protein
MFIITSHMPIVIEMDNTVCFSLSDKMSVNSEVLT